MATAPTYCTHRQLKDVFPQVDSFDNKRALYGWKEVTTNKYAAHNSGLTTQLFVDGEDLGAAQSAHTDLNVEGEWFYNSAEDITYYYSATDPNDKLMESGEEFSTLITRITANASRYLDAKLDPNLPREQLKDKEGNFDYIIVRTAALIAAVFLIRSHDPTSEVANALMEDEAIDSAEIVAGSIDTAHIADNQVTLAKMAGLVRGKIIIGDASGDPSALTVGTADQVLTSNGTDAAWTDAAGGITWLAVVTSATTMAAGNGYFVNTTGSAFSMTLPASASLGDEVHVIDYAGTFDTNNCTVARNSHKISGATSDLVVATERAAFKLVYVDATQGWLLTEL